jgi:hypothetical protein
MNHKFHIQPDESLCEKFKRGHGGEAPETESIAGINHIKSRSDVKNAG